MSTRKQQVVDLLKSLETGDPKPLEYINPTKYIQHNLAVGDGMAGLGVLFASLPKGATRVNAVRTFEDGDIVFNRRREEFPVYFDGTNYIQHNPWVADQLTGLAVGLQALAREGRAVHYDRVHKILGEGSFVLVISEGTFGEQPTAYYDLYRIEQGKIAEHWDVLEAIPSRSEWKNPNGKFGFAPEM